MIISFIIVIHLLCAVGAIYCIFHNETVLATYLVMSLLISAIKGNLTAWEEGQDD